MFDHESNWHDWTGLEIETKQRQQIHVEALSLELNCRGIILGSLLNKINTKI